MVPSFSPLDEELGLLPGSLSPTLQDGLVQLGTAMPYGQVPAIMRVLGRVSVSAATVRRLTLTSGAALLVIEETAVTEIERTLPPVPAGADRQQVSVDGAMVPVQGGEWREAKTLVVGAVSATDPGTAEELSYVSRIQPIEPFTQLATGELHRRGTFGASVVVGVVDGAVWCQSFLDHHLPDAVRVLDFPHAVEHLHQAAQACFGAGSPQATAWVSEHAQTLRQGDPRMVLEAVAALPVETAADPAAAATVRDRVYDYLEPRLPQMAYAAFTAQGLPIGSGIVESANKLVVEARLKGAGMHWAERNVDPMLALRCALCSQRWEEVWPQISHTRRAAARRSRPRPHRPPPPPTPAATDAHQRAVLPPAAPRVKTMVNGKPTKDHPWRKPFLFPNKPVPQLITKT